MAQGSMLLRQAVRLPAAPYVRHIPRRMNCRIWAAGMIAKTFFPEQDIYRIGVQSLREKISLRDHWHVTCPSCPVRGLRRPCRFGPGHGRRPRRRPDGHASLHRADRGPALTRRHCAMAHAAGGRGTAPRQSPLALGLGGLLGPDCVDDGRLARLHAGLQERAGLRHHTPTRSPTSCPERPRNPSSQR
jgi:hypothetical protein